MSAEQEKGCHPDASEARGGPVFLRHL